MPPLPRYYARSAAAKVAVIITLIELDNGPFEVAAMHPHNRVRFDGDAASAVFSHGVHLSNRCNAVGKERAIGAGLAERP